MDAEDARRVDAVLRALARLRALDPHPLAQGLSPAGARAGMDAAVGAIAREGLERELAAPGRRPRSLLLVAAHGVFTSPVEWAALYAAAGIPLRIKAPSRDPALCLALGECLRAEGLPVEVVVDRSAVGGGEPPEAVVAFGTDEGVAAVARATPGARHVLFGHRSSGVLVERLGPVAQALAWDAAMYDTRGCMAPSFVLVEEPPTDEELDRLAEEMERAERSLPRGEVDPALGPEWRRRVGLARARGRVRLGRAWAVLELPAEHLVPAALPRMLVVHRVSGPEEAAAVLAPHRGHLSSLATDDALRGERDPRWNAVFELFPRVCPPGTLQRPPFPRRHDGVPMLASVLS